MAHINETPPQAKAGPRDRCRLASLSSRDATPNAKVQAEFDPYALLAAAEEASEALMRKHEALTRFISSLKGYCAGLEALDRALWKRAL
jgi:hypothetical protein